MNDVSAHPRGRARLLLPALLIGLALMMGIPAGSAFAEPSSDGSERAHSIAILHTNDIHAHGLAASDSSIGFGGIASAKRRLQDTYGEDNVLLVDAGDTILGSVVGAVTRGEDIVRLMKASGYDLAVPGNHDFDYGIDRLRYLDQLARNTTAPDDSGYATDVSSTFRYVACNVTNTGTGESLFPGYEIRQLGDVRVAFVGVALPETLEKEDPSIFQEGGELVWDFHGSDLVQRVRESVADALADGADYVIAVTHLGQGASASLISQVENVDAVIDAHSHSLVRGEFITNGGGERIPIAQCGTRFQAYGTMLITPSDDPSPGDITSTVTDASAATTETADPQVEALVAKVEGALSERVIGTTEVRLTVNSQGGETNLGNFVADAYRHAVPGAEVGLVNAGGIESPSIAPDGVIPAGSDITLAVLGDVNPYGDAICELEMSGQTLRDILVRSSGRVGTKQFLQVSGIRMQGSGATLSVSVLDADGKSYIPLDPSHTYRVATSSFLASGGDGYEQFRQAKLVSSDYGRDYEALATWLSAGLGSIIGDRYATTDGRIDPSSSSSSGTGGAGNTNKPGATDGSTGSTGSGGSSSVQPAPEPDTDPDVPEMPDPEPEEPVVDPEIPDIEPPLAPGDGPSDEPVPATLSVHRLYNPHLSGAHLLTADPNEVKVLTSLGWRDEGARFSAYANAEDGAEPVYRLYNPSNGDHFYTASKGEANALRPLGWQVEGVAWYGAQSGASPTFRLYNPHQTANGGLGNHLWTVSEGERDGLVELGWLPEDVAWHSLPLVGA